MKYKLIPALVLLIAMVQLSCSTGQDEDALVIEPAAAVETGLARVPVEVMVVKDEIVEHSIDLSGAVAPIHSVEIVAESSGKVVEVFKKLGDRVTPSDTLALLDDVLPLSRYKQVRAQVWSAENNLKIAQLNSESDKELFENGDISKLTLEKSLLAVKTAQASQLSAMAAQSAAEKEYVNTRVTSPIKGWISRKYIDLGTMVNMNMPVYRVVDISTLVVEVGVPQNAIKNIHVGLKATVTISALPQRTFSGVVKFVSPEADQATGTFETQVYVKNTDALDIRAGMTARVQLISRSDDPEIVIPDYAVMSRNDSTFVYRIENQMANLTAIEIRDMVGSLTIVDNGLAQGDSIVVVGMKNLGITTPVSIQDSND